MRKQTAIFLIVLSVVVTSCIFDSDKKTKLNTSSHSVTDSYWGEGEIEVDYSWRFVSYTKNDSEYSFSRDYFVDGSWIITFRNTTNSIYEVIITRIVFKDKDGFEITENNTILNIPVLKTTLDAGESATYQSTFRIDVSSLDVANSITNVDLRASITKQ